MRMSEPTRNFEKVVDQIAEGVLIAVRGRPVYANPQFARMFGYDRPEDILALDSYFDLVAPHEHERVRGYERLRTAGGTAPDEYEVECRHAQGHVIYLRNRPVIIEWEGRPAVLATVIDVSERRKQRERLVEQTRILNLVLEHMDQGISLFDEDLNCLAVNRKLLEMLDLSADKIKVGCKLDDIIRPLAYRGDYGGEDPEQEFRSRMQVLSEQRHLRSERIDPNGRSIELRQLPVPGGGFVAIHTDITHHRRNEENLKEAIRTAELANRAKSAFLATMSHELRTPMNGVLGMTDMLLASDLDPEQRHQATLIKSSGEALLGLLNDILDLSKIEAGEMSMEEIDFDPVELLDGIEALWAPKLREKSVGLRFETSTPLPRTLRSDPTRIRQILFNLIGNAHKFTERGDVHVRTGARMMADGQVELRFDVADTGIGIPPEAHDTLFSKFTQADSSVTRRFGGTGLGLAICRELAGLLGGEIDVESEPGVGSTFWFTVRCAAVVDKPQPAADAAPPVDPDPARVDTGGAGASLRILVAEDNLVNRSVITAMLKKLGHRCDTVENGLEALDALVRSPFDLVLMDVQMPVMDGLTATRRIRGLPGSHASIPVVALTANAMKGDREECLNAGMDDFLTKPIAVNELQQMLAGYGRFAGSGDDGDEPDTSWSPAPLDAAHRS